VVRPKVLIEEGTLIPGYHEDLRGGERADGVGFYGYLLAPAYRDVNDAQLAPRFSALVGLSKTF